MHEVKAAILAATQKGDIFHDSKILEVKLAEGEVGEDLSLKMSRS